MCESEPYTGPYVYYPGGTESMSSDPVIRDYDKKPSTDLPDLKGAYEADKLPIQPEPFSHVTFEDALNHINPAYSILGDGKSLVSDTSTHGLMLDSYDPREAQNLKDVHSGGQGLAGQWGTVRDEIARVTSNFSDALNSLMNDKEHWDGQTKISAFENVKKSFQAPDLISQSAGVMQTLIEGFTQTVGYVYKNIEGNRPSYLMNVKAWNSENEHDRSLNDYINEYNTFARKVLGEDYSTNIQSIAGSNPKFTTGDLPDLGGDDPPPPTGPGPGTGGGIPPFSGGAPLSTPDFKTPKLPTGPDGLPTGPDGLPTGPDGLGDPTQAASDMAPTGLGSPTQAASAMPNANDAGKRPPEGALGLGPKGVGDLRRKGSGAGGGGGIGGGPLGPKLASSRPASAPVAAAKASPVGAAGGAGLGAGSPGMGAPAAGHGAGQNDKGYQVNKALRRKKTGEQVMGKADAVVPVVGEPEKPGGARTDAEADQTEAIT